MIDNKFVPKKNKKFVCFYHSPCFDGLVAAWLLHTKFDENISFIPANYTVLPNLHSKECDDASGIIFLDYSPNKNIIDQALKCKKLVSIIDHHPQTKNLFDRESNSLKIYYDCTKSGASLVWSLFFNKDIPDFIQLIEDIDLNKIPPRNLPEQRNKYFQAAAFIDSHDLNAPLEVAENWISKAILLSLDELAKEGKYYRAELLNKIKETIKYFDRIHISNQPLVLVKADIEELGHEFFPILIETTHIDIAAAWHVCSDHVRINIRSHSNSSVIEVRDTLIKNYSGNGGGHAHASVVRLTYNQFHKFCADYKLGNSNGMKI